MNVKGAAVEGFLARPDPRVAVFLLYGPDNGLVTDRARRLVAAFAADPNDPFLVTDAQAETVAAQPGRLIEEAQSLSLMGGRRVVRLRQADAIDPRYRQAFAEDLRRLLALPAIEAAVILEAGELPASSSLRRQCERSDSAAALPCYREEGTALRDMIRGGLREGGLGVEPDALRFLETHLGADREVTRREIEKLVLYMQGSDASTVRVEDAEAVVGDGSAHDLDEWVWTCLNGDFAAARALLLRLLAEKQAPVRLARVLASALQRLLPLALKVGVGTPPPLALKAAKPPIFWKYEAAAARALEGWTPEGLAQALATMAATERRLKSTGIPDGLVLEHAVLELCQAAGERVRRAAPARPGSR